MIPEPPPIANFFLLVTGGTAIWWDLKRSQRNTKVSLSVPPTKEDTRQWLSSYAIFEFADAKLMRSAEKAERNVQNLEEEYQKLEQERRNRMPQRPMGTMGGPAPEPTSEAFEALAESAATAFNRAQAEKNVRDRARRKALDDLYDKLSTGTLIAKGFHDPIGNRGEVEIPPSEWRILRFNGDYTEAQGRGLKYIGIAVAKTAFKVE